MSYAAAVRYHADETTLASGHDCLLLDLDGTAFRGSRPTAGAVETLSTLATRAFFLTNNASRAADEVAEHMRELGFSAQPDDIVTSAQSAAHLLAERLPRGSAVLVVGTESLAAEVANVGLAPVRSTSDAPIAVVQGHSPHTGWADLCEAALAIRAGALWIATNGDVTLPTERGLVPGNGSMVAALRAATGSEPTVAGKPAPAMVRDALARGDFHNPLMVGDRLDTDIAGANAAGVPSLLVLTGVGTPADVIRAEPRDRPTYIAEDLRALNQVAPSLRIGPQDGWHTEIDCGTVTISSDGVGPHDGGLAVVRAVAHAVWDANLGASPLSILAGDDHAGSALQRWRLLDHL